MKIMSGSANPMTKINLFFNGGITSDNALKGGFSPVTTMFMLEKWFKIIVI